jgi:glycosyltransferase involved in cell wall biosynthesis
MIPDKGRPMPFPPCDVVIPAHNAAATLARAITSVLAQTAPDLRLFVIDDGSRDATPDIARSFAAADARVTLIRQTNGGISAAMNAGIAAGHAPFVARLDADDLSAPDRHSRQLTHLLTHPRTVAVSGAHREIRADGTPTGRTHRPPFATAADPARAPAVEPPLTQPFTMMRREALLAAGSYRPFPVSEDSDLYWRLAERGDLVSLPDIMGSYRLHAASISAASIVGGRLMAVCSQLAAISARRRAARASDVVLPPNPLWRDEGDIAPMVARAAVETGLTAPEIAWLHAAAAAKLMELAGYRPFDLDDADCAFIAAALDRDVTALRADNRADLVRMRAATSARLLRGGRLRAALTLSSATLLPQTVLRAATGRLYWTKHPV